MFMGLMDRFLRGFLHEVMCKIGCIGRRLLLQGLDVWLLWKQSIIYRLWKSRLSSLKFLTFFNPSEDILPWVFG